MATTTTLFAAAAAVTAVTALLSSLGRREEKPRIIAKQKNTSATVIFTTLEKAKVLEKILQEQESSSMNYFIVTSFSSLKKVLASERISNTSLSLITDNIFTTTIYKNVINFLNGIQSIDLWIVFQSSLVNSALQKTSSKARAKRINSKSIFYSSNIPVIGKYELKENINDFFQKNKLPISKRIETLDDYFLFLKNLQDISNKSLASSSIDEYAIDEENQENQNQNGEGSPAPATLVTSPIVPDISQSDQYKSFNTILLEQLPENIDLYFKSGYLIAHFNAEGGQGQEKILRLVRDQEDNYEPVRLLQAPADSSLNTEILNNKWYVDVEVLSTPVGDGGSNVQLTTVQSLLDNGWILIQDSNEFLRSILKTNEKDYDLSSSSSSSSTSRNVSLSLPSLSLKGSLSVFHERLLDMKDFDYYAKTEYLIGLEEAEVYKISYRKDGTTYVRFLQKLDLFGNGFKLFEILVTNQDDSSKKRPYTGTRFDSSLTYFINKACYYDFNDDLLKYLIEDKEYSGVTIQSSSKSVVDNQNTVIDAEFKQIHDRLTREIRARRLETPRYFRLNESLIKRMTSYFSTSNNLEKTLDDAIRTYYGVGELHIFYDFIVDVYLVRLGKNNNFFFSEQDMYSDGYQNKWFLLYTNQTINGIVRKVPVNHATMFNIMTKSGNRVPLEKFLIRNTVYDNEFYMATYGSKWRLRYRADPIRPCSPWMKNIFLFCNGFRYNDYFPNFRTFVDFDRYLVYDSFVSLFNVRNYLNENVVKNDPSAPPYSYFKYTGQLYNKKNYQPDVYYQELNSFLPSFMDTYINPGVITLSKFEKRNDVSSESPVNQPMYPYCFTFPSSTALAAIPTLVFSKGSETDLNTGSVIFSRQLPLPYISDQTFFMKKSFNNFNNLTQKRNEFAGPLKQKIYDVGNVDEFLKDYSFHYEMTSRKDGSGIEKVDFYIVP